MKGIRKTALAVCLAALGLACPMSHSLWAQDEEPDDSQIELIIEFISDADRETRATGLDYVRTEVPGEAATKRFADLLPTLSPDAQVDLLDALGDRGDVAARPAVMGLLTANNEQTRAAALKTLGALGGVDEVPLLAGWASNAEQTAARQSLIRLKGEEANAAIIKAMATGGPDVRARLLGVLAARGAAEALPTVLESVNDPEAVVRLAALEALRFLADEKNTAALVEMVKDAKDNAQQQKAELTLLVVCSRGGQACAEAIIAGLDDADAPSRIILLRALARAGGPEAMEAIAARLDDDEAEAVGDEAVRMLAGWSDDAVVDRLLEIAKSDKSDRRQVLALRGLVRLASPIEGEEGEEGEPADVETLGKVLKLADRPEEKRLVLGVLGGVATSDALKLAASALKDAKLADDAGLAAVLIAEAMEDGDKGAIRTAMGNVKKSAKNKAIIDRADKVVESL
ncbi:MAG: HEAT repeat domain-containing protein [Candidatus Nealsonbacteria bacterium]|nr:HEAT repeat domain-containing protein [Candidatus Nealsonbacteria bacterium]